MSIVSAELCEAWTLRRRSGAQMARPATTYRIELDLDREFHDQENTTSQRMARTSSATQTEKRLTDRELQVIQLAATGATDREIADALFISRRTVTSHMANILFKLNVGNRTAAAVVASRSGLIL